MNDNKKILLYRIDEQTETVVFVVTENDEKAWENISDDMQIIMSFDEIYTNMKAFRDCSSDNSSNFFTRYYYDTLKDIFLSVGAEIDKTETVSGIEVMKKSIEYMGEVLDDIREVIRGDWIFGSDSENDEAFSLSYDKIIIQGDDRYEIYTVADTSLVNFFYEFSFVLHSKRITACSCKYCGKPFLGIKDSVCCDNEECQVLFKNEERRAKSKEDYNAHMTKFTSFLSQRSTRLKHKVHGDTKCIEKFKSCSKELKDRLKAEINRCRAENIIPGEEQDKFLKNLEAEVKRFQSQIEEEWKAEQE